MILTTVAILAIDRLHEVTAYKSDPREALNYIHQQALMAIMRMKKDTELKAKYLQNINEKLDPRYSKSFSANVFNKTGLDGLSEYIISIIEISEILITKNQNSLVSYSIDVIQSILVHYLLFRKDSSIATPVFPFLSYESDSQQFLTKVFENIDELVKFAFVNDKERTIIKILDLYENVAIVSTEIDFDNIQLSQGNPITQVIVGYLHQLILKAKLNKQVEPLFQSARVLNNIAIVFLNKSLYFQIKSVTEYLDEISYQGMILRSDVLYNRAIEFQINLLPFLMKSDFGDVGIKSIIEDILKDIFETNLLLDKLNRPIFSYYSRLSPFTLHLGIKLEIMFQSALNTENEDSKEKINLLIFLEEYARYLRDYFSKNNSTSLVTPVANTIETINKYLLAWYKNEETSQIREQVKDVLKRYTYLPYWMIDKKIKLDYGKYYDLIEQTTIIGIKSKTEVIDNDLFETSVSALIAILRKFNHKDNVGRGYDEPKVALNLVFLGILALKNADEKEFIKIGLELLDFEKEYLAKYPEMLEKMSDFDELQLLKSIWSVRDDLFD
ncbi:MAG: hypothetical protein KDC90_18650, partial [Ignavibacteriae bacterium]|nr:hypothetical protein [Ignavibacteriota bacterium]